MNGETVSTLIFIVVEVAVIQIFITAIVWIEVKAGRIRKQLLTESEPKQIERRRIETTLITEKKLVRETKRITETTTETETIVETERIQ